MAAVANCFVLSFKVVAQASGFEWLSIDCESDGTLDKTDEKIQFTRICTKECLRISSEETRDQGEKLLRRSEQICLISNSLSCETELEYQILCGDV